MKQFDLVFVGEHGKYTLEECHTFPTKEELEGVMEACEEVGTGEITEIVIKNIK